MNDLKAIKNIKMKDLMAETLQHGHDTHCGQKKKKVTIDMIRVSSLAVIRFLSFDKNLMQITFCKYLVSTFLIIKNNDNIFNFF